MKRSKLFMLTMIIVSMIILLPFLLGFLMKKEWFYFVSGQIDSWIEFWGSYIGAIIGSIVVFIVAKIQIKKRHEQQVEDIKRESDILYKSAMEGYLLRNKIKKIDDMIHMADELYDTISKQEKEMFKMVEMSILDDANLLEMADEESEEQYNIIYDNITNYTNLTLGYIRKLWTLCSYVPEAKEELTDIQELLNTFDQNVTTLFNTEGGYKHFVVFHERKANIHFPVMREIHQRLPEFITYNLKTGLSKNLQEIQQIAGEWIELK